jgi:SAM-dependent methyltransferase
VSGETFAPEWLLLREAADHRSRAKELLQPFEAWWHLRGALHVLDLGAGTGSNARYLAPRLGGTQRWTVVDRDPLLLSLVQRPGDAALPGVVSVKLVRGDLAREGLDAVPGAELVTASALLDLVSQSWLDALVAECKKARCAALFVLTWDGTIAWETRGTNAVDPDDALVLDAVRAHQRRDKGLGPALGPTGGAAAERAFQSAGFRTWTESSPWILRPGDAELAHHLVAGWESAATEQLPDQAERIHHWAERRRTTATAGSFRLTVGHVDLLALPE